MISVCVEQERRLAFNAQPRTGIWFAQSGQREKTYSPKSGGALPPGAAGAARQARILSGAENNDTSGGTPNLGILAFMSSVA